MTGFLINTQNRFPFLKIGKQAVAALFLVLLGLFNTNLEAQTTNIPKGSLVIDMGVLPQTVENGLKPYGLAYELINVRKVPILWSINPLKAKDGVDFTVDGRSFSGGPFVVHKQFLGSADVQSTIATWEAKGVITYTTQTDVVIDVYNELITWPQWVLDTDNGGIAEDYLDLAEIPSSAYRMGLPSSLGPCDDLFILPHADPNWTDHGNLYTWTDSFANGGSQGWIWSGCHGVSALEDLYNPLNPSQQLNFLANKTTTASLNGDDYFENSLILWGNHDDASEIYPYNTDFPADPYMQFMGYSDGAHSGGSEQIYLPVLGGSWRSSTRIGAWDANQADFLAGSTPGKAALIAYGYAYGDTSRGKVMYEGGHKLDNGTEAENVAAIRAFLNFSFDAPTARAPELVDNVVVPLTVEGGETINFDVDAIAPFGSVFNFTWESTCANGFFLGTTSTATNSSTSYVTTPVFTAEQCIITLRVIDPSCGKESFKSYGITIIPPPVAPVASDDNYTTYSSSSITFNPLENDIDANSNMDPSSLTANSPLIIPGQGQFVINANATVSFYPDSGFIGSATLNYTICDDTPVSKGGPLCDSALITVEVVASPCAVDETVAGTTDYGTSIVNSNKWKKPERALGPPDTDFSKSEKDAESYVIIDLGGIAVVGSQITFRVFSDDGDTVTGTLDAATTSSGFPNNPLSVSTNVEEPSVQLITYTVTESGTLYVRIDGNKNFGLESVAYEKETCVPAIVANDDDFSASTINGTIGGVAGDVTTNDTYGGAPVVDANIAITLLNNGGLTGVSIDSNGNITIPIGAAAGIYSVTYNICDNTYPTNCDIAVARVKVDNDSDSDGVFDSIDLDDDNDGILDTVENECVTNTEVNSPGYATSTALESGTTGTLADLAANGSNAIDFNYTLSGTATWDTGIQLKDEGGAVGSTTLNLQPTNASDGNGAAIYEFVFEEVSSIQNITFGGLEFDDRLSFKAYDSNGDQIVLSSANFTTGGSVTTYGNEYTYVGALQSFSTANYANEIVSIQIDKAVKRIVVTSGKADSATDNNGIEVYHFSYCTILDSDADGIGDYLELDSDNDGCYDTIEAGFTDPDNDGVLGNSPVTVDANGQVTGQGGYTTPDDENMNSTYDFQEAGIAPSISLQPANTTVFSGAATMFSVGANNADSYQWQISTDGGTIFTDLDDLGIYSNTTTSTFNISTVDVSMDGYQYRVIVSNNAFKCSTPSTSNAAVLRVKVRNAITNRRITYRVK